MRIRTMAFTAELETAGTIPVIKCSGDLVLGENTATLARATETALASSGSCLVHMGDVARVDAHGIGVLVQLLVSAREHGSSVHLIEVPQRIADLLRITGLAKVTGINTSGEQSAKNDVSPHRASWKPESGVPCHMALGQDPGVRCSPACCCH